MLHEIEEEESLLSMLESADAVSCCFDAATLPTLVLRLASSRKCCDLRGPGNEQISMNFLSQPPSDVGIVVSIAAFQAVDPGSIPGHRILLQLF